MHDRSAWELRWRERHRTAGIAHPRPDETTLIEPLGEQAETIAVQNRIFSLRALFPRNANKWPEKGSFLRCSWTSGRAHQDLCACRYSQEPDALSRRPARYHRFVSGSAPFRRTASGWRPPLRTPAVRPAIRRQSFRWSPAEVLAAELVLMADRMVRCPRPPTPFRSLCLG